MSFACIVLMDDDFDIYKYNYYIFSPNKGFEDYLYLYFIPIYPYIILYGIFIFYLLGLRFYSTIKTLS